jgi:hypothetical protein
MNVKDPEAPFPDEFMKSVPATNWYGWSRQREGLASKPPWSFPYCNPYLFHMGSVFKFGPAGGMVYGYQNTEDDRRATPGSGLESAPDDAVPFKSGYMNRDVKVAGAKWRYPGVGIIPASGVNWGDPMCVCLLSQLDTDPYGRTFAPSVFYSSVEMIDAAGNRIARIGRYGNADDDGIAFAWPTCVDFAESNSRLYVTDSVNRRVLVVRFDYQAEAVSDVK